MQCETQHELVFLENGKVFPRDNPPTDIECRSSRLVIPNGRDGGELRVAG